MYKRILIPTDGSELSLAAIEQGLAFAKGIGASVTFLTVTEPFQIFAISGAQLVDSRATYAESAKEEGTRRLREAETRASALGVPCRTRLVENDAPYRAIIEAASDDGCDLIAMASHGRRGIGALMLGSETLKVLTYSTIPVLVYRKPPAR
ncbi:universal stress protein [Luteimonas sp. MC1828]|uniref:universal stress protein n=1 Tax=Luteimonas sp. MC1828 TaxID=2799787 RepID=UPI0018F24D9F|nr:universal stress protein [Luteimonas sp. MC1828]MBJ7576078.1 universal stress protein [Luteimonas sp. MC1828]